MLGAQALRRIALPASGLCLYPIAILALFLWPIVWLLSLPLRLIGITLEAVFALLRAVLFLPARLLGYRGGR